LIKYNFIQSYRKEYKIVRLCEVLEVSRSGFYDWVYRPESNRSIENRRLTGKIKQSHCESNEIYGSPKIHKDLVYEGESCSVNRVARLMKASDIKSKLARKFVVEKQNAA